MVIATGYSGQWAWWKGELDKWPTLKWWFATANDEYLCSAQ